MNIENYFTKIETKNNRELLDTALQVWKNLKFTNPDLSEPNVVLGDRDNIMLTWSNAEHYLECEIFAQKQIEFFHRDKTINAVWGADVVFDKNKQYLTHAIIHRFKIFEN
jgi:hypothetical protein